MFSPQQGRTLVRRVFALTGVLALAASMAACGNNNSDDNGGGGDSTAAQDVQSAAVEASASGDAATVSGELPVLKSATGKYNVYAQTFEYGEVRIDINDVSISDDLTVVTFSATNVSGREVSLGLLSRSRTIDRDVSAVELIDQKNKKVYRAAHDEEDRCLCSRLEGAADQVQAGDTVSLYATFAALPDDVETVDIRVPGVEQLITDVQVSR
ncbi:MULTISPECIES: hypothetical protein [unclassified Actinobaculum]|uniref:hypothetical protein n=1 Tax=unclassified Actinobaculum TaxID=2609299 RepID=UPI000D52815F|nr:MULTISPECIES: hypothetical protein [unclassified Actinobaculum]AWE42737.1 hypothetical protein DDD63_08270 [Actinobaculum sp. 313]RTE49555.1 hypothetical protein EKN07_05760 [Actinobaculum sp. 352]